jgi:hypothetical protein
MDIEKIEDLPEEEREQVLLIEFERLMKEISLDNNEKLEGQG